MLQERMEYMQLKEPVWGVQQRDRRAVPLPYPEDEMAFRFERRRGGA
jgi:hypothetical protein